MAQPSASDAQAQALSGMMVPMLVLLGMMVLLSLNEGIRIGIALENFLTASTYLWPVECEICLPLKFTISFVEIPTNGFFTKNILLYCNLICLLIHENYLLHNPNLVKALDQKPVCFHALLI